MVVFSLKSSLRKNGFIAIFVHLSINQLAKTSIKSSADRSFRCFKFQDNIRTLKYIIQYENSNANKN